MQDTKPFWLTDMQIRHCERSVENALAVYAAAFRACDGNVQAASASRMQALARSSATLRKVLGLKAKRGRRRGMTQGQPLYVYIIKAGPRREAILGCYTDVWLMRQEYLRLFAERQDLLVRRFSNNSTLGSSVIIQHADIVRRRVSDSVHP